MKLIPTEQKIVSFHGAEIMAAKANDGKVYAGVRWICEGLGIDPRRQREKLQQHMTLSKGVSTLTLPSNGGPQDTLVIDLDYLPLWLATINPALVGGAEAQQKLIEYQLKAKDTLAAAFISDRKVVPLSERQALIQSLKLTAELAEEVEEVKTIAQTHGQKLLELEQKVDEQITLDHGEQRTLQKAVARKVYELEADPKRRSELFRQLHREIKDRWAVASYRDVRRHELQQVLRYIDAWMPRKVS